MPGEGNVRSLAGMVFAIMLKGCIPAKIGDFETQVSENAKYCYPASGFHYLCNLIFSDCRYQLNLHGGLIKD